MARLHVGLALTLVFISVSAGAVGPFGREEPVDRATHHDRDRADLDGYVEHGDDDDDDDDAIPIIRVGISDVDASPPTLVLAGTGFCRSPRLSAGRRDGTLSELVVFNSSEGFVQAGLDETTPGTYRVEVACPSGKTSIDLTLGAVGPRGDQGPPGDNGITAGQICPDGTVAIGFDLEGTLQCTARPPVVGACPCVSEDELAGLRRIIEEGTMADPDASGLACVIGDDFIAVDFGLHPASGAEATEINLFARDDVCGLRTQIPGQGVVETSIRPIAPDEAAACNASIFETGIGLGCF